MVPQFNKETLEKNLDKYKNKYIYVPQFGGRRKIKNVHHTSIRSHGFSSYAEYMMTQNFEDGF